MNYSSLISQSWRLVWRRKSLIALAFLSILASSLAYVAVYTGFIALFFSTPFFFTRLTGLGFSELGLSSGGPLAYGAMAASALGWLLLWFVGLSARGGLIASVDAHEDGRPLGLGGAFGRGWRRALTLAAMAFLLYLPVIVMTLIGQVLVISQFPEFLTMNEAEMMSRMMSIYALSCSLSVLTYGLMAFLQFIYAFAFRGVVLGNLGVVASIRHGWRVVRGNIGDILPLAMIYGGILLALIIIWYIAFFALYFVVIFALAMGGGDMSAPLLVALGAGFLVLLLLTFVVGAIALAWRSAAFTIGYRHWIAEKPVVVKEEDSTDFTDGTD